MSKWRRASKVDTGQAKIVSALRTIPGVTVETGHDDFLVGFKKNTFWFELKSSLAVSKKTGKVLESSKKASQKRLEAGWSGHYKIVSTLDEILQELGINGPQTICEATK